VYSGPVTHEELVETLTRALAARPEVLDAYLFGSTARGTAGPLSDVDVAVTLDEGALEDEPYGAAATLAADLMAALGRNDVDLVLLNRARPLLAHRAVTRGIRLFSRDLAATTTREGRILSRYCDLVPHLAKVARAARARTESGRFGT